VIKCHYYHIISKVTLCSFLIFYSLLIISNLLVISNIDKRLSDVLINKYYFVNTFETIKIFTIIVICFIYGYSFTKENDSYVYFIIGSNISREKYIISKIILLFILDILFVLLLCISFYLIPIFFGYIVDIKYFMSFIYLIVLSVYYGMLTIILVLKVNSFYVCLFPILLYIIFSQGLVDNKLMLLLMLIGEDLDIILAIYVGAIMISLNIFIIIYIYKEKNL